ncbi:MAG: hypothetical protein B6D56_06670, partial [Candidatus Omnitrophica bacterium 4484_70.1]
TKDNRPLPTIFKLSEEDFKHISSLSKLSDKQLRMLNIQREGKKYSLIIEDKKYPLNYYTKDGKEHILDISDIFILPLKYRGIQAKVKFAVIRFGKKKIEESLKMIKNIGGIYTKEGKPYYLTENDLKEIVEGGYLYSYRIEDKVYMEIKNYKGISGELVLGRKGLKIVHYWERTFFAKFIGEDGQVIYKKEPRDLPYTIKAKLIPDAHAPPKFRLRKATPEEIKGGKNIVDAYFEGGKKYLVEFNLLHKQVKEYSTNPVLFIRDLSGEFRQYPLNIDTSKYTITSEKFDLTRIDVVREKEITP